MTGRELNLAAVRRYRAKNLVQIRAREREIYPLKAKGAKRNYYIANTMAIKEQQRNRYKKASAADCLSRREYARNWAAKQTVEYRKNTALKRAHGITKDQYDLWYQQVDGKCEICGIDQPVLCVDHDHGNNKLRGLLCRQCNFSIGLLQDNPVIVENAVKYLRR